MVKFKKKMAKIFKICQVKKMALYSIMKKNKPLERSVIPVPHDLVQADQVPHSPQQLHEPRLQTFFSMSDFLCLVLYTF